MMDTRRLQRLTVQEFSFFLRATIPSYHSGRELAEALFRTISGKQDPGPHERIKLDLFVEKVCGSDMLWHIFMTLLPWKFCDQQSNAYTEAKDHLLECLHMTSVDDQYAFETKDSDQLERFLDAAQFSWSPGGQTVQNMLLMVPPEQANSKRVDVLDHE
eukprot:TRINITY_DN14009_c0_g1_i2.p1 TRINITY_DN14009_c0_g1~~TRINITY_DN14009_c0_g1_i2.p1  ORF type:complete len:159 (+),score=26.17 TRINITY_DN14009_c0_g1_i2:167-643(+)